MDEDETELLKASGPTEKYRVRKTAHDLIMHASSSQLGSAV